MARSDTHRHSQPFDSIEEALNDIKKGKFVILVDDEDRENEGDLVIAAEKVTPQAINFMAKHARGLICLALTPERVEELHLPAARSRKYGDLRHGLHRLDRRPERHHDRDFRRRPGHDDSCGDRSQKSKPADLARPGHIFPLKAQRAVCSTRGADRRFGRSGASGGLLSRRRDLRDHERRRHHGARAGVDEVCQSARAEDGDDQGADRIPHAPGNVC